MEGIAHELRFWKGFVQTRRFLDGWLSPSPTPELNPVVRDLLLSQPSARVLDAGSGAVSILHGTVPSTHLVATDPLGSLYAIVFDYEIRGLTPPLAIPAAELAFEGEFDIAHISNALDHCDDPVAALERLKAAARPGGLVIVQGFESEGTHERSAGMHQWDLRLNSERLLLSPAGSEQMVDLGVAESAVRMDLPTRRQWFVWMWRKPA